jgi:hypothetical protein
MQTQVKVEDLTLLSEYNYPNFHHYVFKQDSIGFKITKAIVSK